MDTGSGGGKGGWAKLRGGARGGAAADSGDDVEMEELEDEIEDDEPPTTAPGRAAGGRSGGGRGRGGGRHGGAPGCVEVVVDVVHTCPPAELALLLLAHGCAVDAARALGRMVTHRLATENEITVEVCGLVLSVPLPTPIPGGAQPLILTWQEAAAAGDVAAQADQLQRQAAAEAAGGAASDGKPLPTPPVIVACSVAAARSVPHHAAGDRGHTASRTCCSADADARPREPLLCLTGPPSAPPAAGVAAGGGPGGKPGGGVGAGVCTAPSSLAHESRSVARIESFRSGLAEALAGALGPGPGAAPVLGGWAPAAGKLPIPVNIITGGLGVGKTTTLLRLLRSKPPGEKWAVLVNEFGALGIDAALIEAFGAGRADQVNVADVLVGHKADLATPQQREAFRAWAAQLYPPKAQAGGAAGRRGGALRAPNRNTPNQEHVPHPALPVLLASQGGLDPALLDLPRASVYSIGKSSYVVPYLRPDGGVELQYVSYRRESRFEVLVQTRPAGRPRADDAGAAGAGAAGAGAAGVGGAGADAAGADAAGVDGSADAGGAGGVGGGGLPDVGSALAAADWDSVEAALVAALR
ncbi:hypothetical protein TSOC_008308 [Tetrabaena socialis]|uniref:CobW/HypB/UreG nucleotide-binding domain-containing protein n=1 Tax=Tetrabaena socialis TaxID=47790 RepID=A0A2J7ZYU5_9CHLO|nr:hypothetical protein TSOC_008308 [Tetrabaena socialis]|eukprot:PNH05432.1 hypothetical protein TSOC_008308 [Tetrabaena socialis]